MFCSLSTGVRLARVSLGKHFQTAQEPRMSIISLQGFEIQSCLTPICHLNVVKYID